MWRLIFIAAAVFATSAYARPQTQKLVFPKKINTHSAIVQAAVPSTFPTQDEEFTPVRTQVIVEKRGKNYVPNEYERRQNEGAKYQFSSEIVDDISDLTHQRTEERDGLNVKGMYSYSDGYYKRTVHYVADENGYRVVGMEAVPLKDGPDVDLTGTASVSTAAHGTHVSYKVQSVPVPGPVAKIVDQAEFIETT